MTRKQHGLALAATVVVGCLALLALLIALANRAGAQNDNPAAGFPIVLLGLAAVATLVALGWRAVTRSRRKSSSRR